MIKYLILFMILFSSTALASSCDYILNNDMSHYCRAIENNSTNECNYIQDSDYRHACLAEVNKSSSECNYINNNDLRHFCEIRSK